MKSLVLIAYCSIEVIAHLYVDSSLTELDVLLQARHLDRQFEPSNYFNRYQRLRKRSGGASQQTSQGKNQQKSPKKDQQKGQQAQSRPRQDPNVIAEATVRGPGRANRVEGFSGFLVQNIPAGQVVHRQASHPFVAQASGESTAHPSANVASQPPAEHSVRAKGVGGIVTANVRVPTHGRGHISAQTPVDRQSIDLQGGEHKEVSAGNYGPNTSRVEGSVTDGGKVMVTSVNAPYTGAKRP